MTENEILEKIKECLCKADMTFQLNVALDPDEDGDCYFKDGFLYIDNRKTIFTAEHIDSIKFKKFDEDDRESNPYNDLVSYIRIKLVDGASLYIHDYCVCKDEYIYEYSPRNIRSCHGEEAKSQIFQD